MLEGPRERASVRGILGTICADKPDQSRTCSGADSLQGPASIHMLSRFVRLIVFSEALLVVKFSPSWNSFKVFLRER